jgi:putative phosphoribosyl transferase
MPARHPAAGLRGQAMATVFVARKLALFCIDAEPELSDARAPLLQQALADAVGRLHQCADLAPLPVGLFGLGPAAAAALMAAVAQRARLQAVVVCGGLLEPAHPALPLLSVATLLIVGSEHEDGLHSHRLAVRLLGGATRLETIPGARACLSEPGCFETALHHAANWFGRHLVRR